MKNDVLVRIAAFRRDQIDIFGYTLSLLEMGCQAGLIGRAQVDCVHNDILCLLSETIMKYTRGDSTSVRVETAHGILLSLLYNIDAYTISIADPEEALLPFKNSSVKEIFNHGFALVKACLEECRHLYREIKAKKVGFGSLAYYQTIDEFLPEFFANYDPLFNAQDTLTLASIDYPVLDDDTTLNGVFYIKQYLQKLTIENNFCQLFSHKEAASLLYHYGQVYGLPYQDTLLNLFEVLLTNAIFSRLAGNSANQLGISAQQYELLELSLRGDSLASYESLINGAIEGLIAALGIETIQLVSHIRSFQAILMPRFVSALANGTLKNVMIVDFPAKPGLDINFSAGKRMDDDDFRGLIKEIIACNLPEGKVAQVLAKVECLEDFIDILEADCLFGDEFKLIYDALGDLELSVLIKIAFVEELRSVDLAFLWSCFTNQQPDLAWQVALVQYIAGLNTVRTDAIHGYLLAAWPGP